MFFSKAGEEQLDDIINAYAKKNNLNSVNVILLSKFSASESAVVTVIFEQA